MTDIGIMDPEAIKPGPSVLAVQPVTDSAVEDMGTIAAAGTATAGSAGGAVLADGGGMVDTIDMTDTAGIVGTAGTATAGTVGAGFGGVGQSKISGEVVPAAAMPPQGTMTIQERVDDLARQAGHLRNQTSMTDGDAADLHHDTFRLQLDLRTSELAKKAPVKVLEQLSDLGYAWRDIARMVGVSVPALRRWRSGELPTGDNRRAIAQLLAFTQIIDEDHLIIFEPASWMEVPVSVSAPVTKIDLYAAGQLDVIFELASENCTPEQALDVAEPGWREKYRSDWEVAVAEDGERYIRPVIPDR